MYGENGVVVESAGVHGGGDRAGTLAIDHGTERGEVVYSRSSRTYY